MLNNIEKNNQSFLYNKVLSGKPAMIARFGANEIKAVLYPRFPSLLKFFLKIILCFFMIFDPSPRPGTR